MRLITSTLQLLVIITMEIMSGLTPIIHINSNVYISTVEMIGDNTVLIPIIHHFHSNAYISTVEMIGDNMVLMPIIHHFHSNAYISTVEMIGHNNVLIIKGAEIQFN